MVASHPPAPRRQRPYGCGAAVCLILLALALPEDASAHGIVGRADLPIPPWLFSWAAAIVLVLSFAALASLWPAPRLQQERLLRAFPCPAVVPMLGSLVGLALFGLVIYSGFAGAQIPGANFSVTFVYVAFWVGLPLLSVLAGDLFEALSPWRSLARLVLWSKRSFASRPPKAPRLHYPERLGVWPAVLVILGFGWLELVYPGRDVPATVAALSLAYGTLMVGGMLLFGIEPWASRADGFAVYFSMLARLSVVKYHRGTAQIRRPFTGIAELPIRPGTVALICTSIGVTTFDGTSNGILWRKTAPGVESALSALGLSSTTAIELTYTAGLVLCVALVAGIYRLGVRGMQSVSTRHSGAALGRSFAHTLIPIGFGYLFAHYFSLLIWQGQALGSLISDPLGNGANLIGTRDWRIDYGIVSFAAIWYIQVGALVVGHVGGMTLAHDHSLAVYRRPSEALRSQYWMLFVMVAFTSFGLWVLSAVGT